MAGLQTVSPASRRSTKLHLGAVLLTLLLAASHAKELRKAKELSPAKELNQAEELSRAHELKQAEELSPAHELNQAEELSRANELSPANELNQADDLSEAKGLSLAKARPKKHYCSCTAGGSLGGCSQASQNHVQNGGGEDIPLGSKVPFWKVGKGKVLLGTYGGGYLYSNCNSPPVAASTTPGSDTFFFYNNMPNYTTTFFQNIYVGCLRKKVNKGQVIANFQAGLGGCNQYGSAQAIMGFYARFPQNRRPLGQLVGIGPVTNGARGGASTLLAMVAPAAPLPKGTTWIRVTVHLNGDGVYDVGFADSLTVTLSPK